MEEEPKKNSKLYNKWTMIVALGMGGLSLIVWVASWISRP